MKKNLLLMMMSVVLVLSCLTGCASTRLAEGFKEETIKEQAETIINEAVVNGAENVLPKYLREGYEYENYDEFPVEEVAEELVSLKTGLGEFLGYTQETVVGKKSPDGTEDFAVILVTATYEKNELNFTLTFDLDMNLISFAVK